MKLPTLFDDLATAVKNVLPKEISHFPRTLMFMDQKYSVLEPQIVSWLNFLARRSFTSKCFSLNDEYKRINLLNVEDKFFLTWQSLNFALCT